MGNSPSDRPAALCGRYRALLLAGLLGCLQATAAFAQTDTLLRNFLQNAAPLLQQQPAYPPPLPFRSVPAAPAYPGPPVRPAPPAITPAQTRTEQPSFNCARAASPAEQAICHDAALAELDRSLTTTFARARATGNAADLVEQQRAWIRQRDACGANVACLHQTMAERLASLRRTVAAGSAASLADDSPQPAGRAPAPPETAALPGADPLLRLAHPPAGLRAWPLESIDGHLALGDTNHRPDGGDKLSVEIAEQFFRMIALSLTPEVFDSKSDYFDQEHRQSEVAWCLSRDAIKEVFTAGGTSGWNGWGGSNEFERARSREAFYARYAPLLRDLAPKAPFTLHWIEAVHIQEYDPARGGFPLHTLAMTTRDRREVFNLPDIIGRGGLSVAPGFVVPDLFWPVDKAAAEQALLQLPDRTAELGAVIDVVATDPASKSITLRLRQVSLYGAGGRAKLFDFPVEPDASAPSPTPTVQPVPVASADSADAGRRWGLPTLDGLPVVAPSSQGGALESFGKPSLLLNPMVAGDRTVGAQSLPPFALWARAIEALGLSLSPAAAQALPNDAMATLACYFLPKAAQTRMFGQDSCHFQPMVPGADFALQDGAAAFKAQELPKILAAAPRLPFRLLVVLRTRPKPYDSARGGFKLDYDIPESYRPVSLFESTLDIMLPDFWSASEAEARAFVAAQTGRYTSEAWVALSVEITGATPGDPSRRMGDGGTGLAGGASWRFHSDVLGLFADPALHQALHRFDATFPRLAEPIMGTPAESDPKPLAPMPATGEAALVALEHVGVPPDLAIDWHAAALRRLAFDYGIQNLADWRDADAWGRFFPVAITPDRLSAEATARYQAWTVKRGAAMPDSLTLWRLIYYGGTPGHALPVIGTTTALGPVNLDSTGFSQPGTDLTQELYARGIEPAQLIHSSVAMPGSSMPVYLATPQPADSYLVTLPDTPDRQDNAGRTIQKAVAVQAGFAGLDIVHFGPDKHSVALVMRLVPKSVEVHAGAIVLATLPLAGGTWGKPPEPPKAPPTPQERLLGGAFGPDVVGLRLGMPMADAEAAIRTEMQVGQVLETPEPTPGRDMPPAWLHGRLFQSVDDKESIAVFEGSGPTAGHVAGVWRRMVVAQRADLIQDQVIAAMAAKYGPPAIRGSQTAWNARPISDSYCWSGRTAAWDTWLKDGKPAARTGYARYNEPPQLEVPYPDQGQHYNYAHCGPLLRLKFGVGGATLATDVNEIPVDVFLQDMGIMDWLHAQPGAVPPPPPPPPMKF